MIRILQSELFDACHMSSLKFLILFKISPSCFPFIFYSFIFLIIDPWHFDSIYLFLLCGSRLICFWWGIYLLYDWFANREISWDKNLIRWFAYKVYVREKTVKLDREQNLISFKFLFEVCFFKDFLFTLIYLFSSFLT